MNIQSNFSNQLASYRLKTVSNNNNHGFQKQVSASDQFNRNTGTNFTGIRNYLKLTGSIPKDTKNELKYFLQETADILGVSFEELGKYAKGKTEESIRFLNSMTNKYNATNFGATAAKKEDPQIVIELFDRIKQPKKEHFGMVNETTLTMTDIHKCFGLCEDKPLNILKYKSAYNKLSATHANDSYFNNIINSPNCNEYIENIDNYLPCFKTSQNSKEIIQKLDGDFKNRTSIMEKMCKEYYANDLFKEIPQTARFNKESLKPEITKEKLDTITMMNSKFRPTLQDMEAGDEKAYLRIFKTTNKDNFKFRINFIDSNYHNYTNKNSLSNDELNDLAMLLDYADKNPHAMKVMRSISNITSKTISASKYIELFDKVGAERLSKDTKKITKIFRQNPYEPAESVLKHYEKIDSNPSIIKTIKEMFKRKNSDHKIYSIREQMKSDNISEQLETPKINLINSEVLNNSEKSVALKDVAVSNSAKPKSVKRRYMFKPFTPKAPSAKKLVIINDVDNIIKQKLGSKVYEEQKTIYANNATKLRAGMLDKIFKSIKETRAQERANGTFSKHKSVSNTEAVDLYRRIKGNNKKLVNYMLTKQNADGTRQFNIRDILDTLADANKRILEAKKKSDKLNRFTAQDERNIYESILENKMKN